MRTTNWKKNEPAVSACGDRLVRGLLLSGALALALMAPCIGMADAPAAVPPTSPYSLSREAAAAAAPAYSAAAAPAPSAASRKLSWETGAGKSYWIPALEIIAFDTLLNVFDRHYFGCCDYDTNLSTIRRNLRRSWVTENDPFRINQLGHPYQGSMYHGFARSAGLSYWESLAYTFGGSIFWEIAGETTPPSKNDQIASGIGGTFLGEALFRMSSLVLENANGTPRPWREFLAATISPPTGFNRLAFGDRFDTVFSSNKAVYYSRFALGANIPGQNIPGTSTKSEGSEVQAEFSIDYGLPGKSGYHYKRPFDYFAFQATASSSSIVENVMTRGLLFGTDYDVGKHYRGVWGIYGSYDYLAPQFFRLSSTALSLGTTGQLWLSNSVALQGTAMVGAGYAAVGTVRGVDERDYHYGVAPQALLALRVIFGERASLDITGRNYYVTRISSGDPGGHDDIARLDVGLTWRIHKQHAIAARYVISRRDSTFPDLGDRTQQRGTFGIFYTLLGHDRFGAVEWR